MKSETNILIKNHFSYFLESAYLLFIHFLYFCVYITVRHPNIAKLSLLVCGSRDWTTKGSIFVSNLIYLSGYL